MILICEDPDMIWGDPDMVCRKGKRRILFTPDPAEYNSNLGLNINNKALPMALHPKVLGLTLDPKLTSRT